MGHASNGQGRRLGTKIVLEHARTQVNATWRTVFILHQILGPR
jgi:hypothetical protein